MEEKTETKVSEKDTKKHVSAKTVWATIGLYVMFILAGTALFILSFHTPLLAGIDVYFYRGTALIVLWGVLLLAAILLMRMHIFKLLGIKDAICIVCLFCCINMVVFTLVPVTVERSVSVFLLAQMDANNTHVYSEDEMGTLLKEDYIDKNGAVQKRCEEQIATGSIKQKDGGYIITAKGQAIVRLFRLVSGLYGCNSTSLRIVDEK